MNTIYRENIVPGVPRIKEFQEEFQILFEIHVRSSGTGLDFYQTALQKIVTWNASYFSRKFKNPAYGHVLKDMIITWFNIDCYMPNGSTKLKLEKMTTLQGRGSKRKILGPKNITSLSKISNFLFIFFDLKKGFVTVESWINKLRKLFQSDTGSVGSLILLLIHSFKSALISFACQNQHFLASNVLKGAINTSLFLLIPKGR